MWHFLKDRQNAEEVNWLKSKRKQITQLPKYFCRKQLKECEMNDP